VRYFGQSKWVIVANTNPFEVLRLAQQTDGGALDDGFYGGVVGLSVNGLVSDCEAHALADGVKKSGSDVHSQRKVDNGEDYDKKDQEDEAGLDKGVAALRGTAACCAEAELRRAADHTLSIEDVVSRKQ